MEFDKKVTFGDLIQIVLIVVAITIGYATLMNEVKYLQVENKRLGTQQAIMQQQMSDTYVRKDVFDQVMLRLEDIKQTVDKIERRQ